MTESNVQATSPKRKRLSLKTLTVQDGHVLTYGQSFDIINNTLAWSGVAFGPSDCGYALWALPTHPRAIALIDSIRGDHTTELPLSVSGPADASRYVAFEATHMRIASRAWPGGVTIVAPAKGRAGKAIAGILRGGRTIGVRVSRSVTEHYFVACAGMPITSAAIRAENGSLVTSYNDAHDLVLNALQRAEASGPTVPVVGVRDRLPTFHFERASTVVEIQRGRGLVIHREGDWDRRALTSIMREVSPGEYGDAT